MYFYLLAIKTYIIIIISQNTISEPELSSSQGELTKKKTNNYEKSKDILLLLLLLLFETLSQNLNYRALKAN